MNRFGSIGMAIVSAVLIASSASRGQDAGVELKVLKYDDLKRAVLEQRGKVVLVDFWEYG